MALSALALVGIIAALVIEGRPGTSTVTPTSSEELPIATIVPPPEQTAAPSSGEVTADDAEALVSAYVDAYNAEDPDALTALMTTDVVRTNGDEPPVKGASAVADAYAAQFDALEAPTYTFTPTNFEPSQDEALVSGAYTIESAKAEPASGGIAFHMVRVDGDLLIDRLDIVPAG